MMHFSNTSIYKLKSDHKVTNVAYSGDKEHLFVSFCCSIIVKVECGSRKIVCEQNLKEMNSFTDFQQIPGSQSLLFYTPSKILRLNGSLEVEKQYCADIKKGKFIQNVKFSPELSVFAIQRSNDILIFTTDNLDLQYVLQGNPGVINNRKIGFLFFGNSFFLQHSQQFKVSSLGEEPKALALQLQQTRWI